MLCSVAKRLKAATNAEEERLTATNNPATNVETATNERLTVATNEKSEKKVAGGVSLGPTQNRRAREAYNAYQREYMRKRRASH
jgi:hypothetical protein